MNGVVTTSEYISLCLPGINQFYYYDNTHLTYSKLLEEIFAILKVEKIINNLNNDTNSAYEEYEKYLNHLNESSQVSNIVDYLNEKLKMFLDKITFVEQKHLNHLQDTLDKKIQIKIFNSNKAYLLIDNLVINHFTKANINIVYNTTAELKQSIQNNPLSSKFTIVCHDSLALLDEFNNLGAWTVYLTPHIYSHEDLKADSEINILRKNNKSCLHNKTFLFSSNNFYQLAYFYNQILQLSLTYPHSDFENLKKELQNKIDMAYPVLLFVRTLRRSQEFKKQKYYISSEKVLYLTELGCDDVSDNLNFKCLLTKAVEVSDLKIYSEKFSHLSDYCNSNNIVMANDIPSMNYFVEKDLMSEYLEKFTHSEKVEEICNKFKIQIHVPFSITKQAKELVDKEKFISILKENKINFPLVIKYKGQTTFFKHLISFVFTPELLDNFINYLKGVELEGTNCVIQNFVNHGGIVMKMYHINDENYLDYRSSLPDISDEFQALYPQGFWNFKTIELETEVYKNLLKKYHTENIIEKIVSQDNMMNFIHEIVNYFQEYSKFTLFGLDFLLDYKTNSFYFIDCNSLPGYKIKNIDISEKFTQHFLKLKNKNE